jgi:hypothetical protein
MTHYVYDQELRPHPNCSMPRPVSAPGQVFESLMPGQQATDVIPRSGGACRQPPLPPPPPNSFHLAFADALQLGFADEQAGPTLQVEANFPTIATLQVNDSTSPPPIGAGFFSVMGAVKVTLGPKGRNISGESVEVFATPTAGGVAIDVGPAVLTPTDDPTVFAFSISPQAGVAPFNQTGTQYNFFATYAGDELNAPSESNVVLVTFIFL